MESRERKSAVRSTYDKTFRIFSPFRQYIRRAVVYNETTLHCYVNNHVNRHDSQSSAIGGSTRRRPSSRTTHGVLCVTASPTYYPASCQVVTGSFDLVQLRSARSTHGRFMDSAVCLVTAKRSVQLGYGEHTVATVVAETGCSNG